MHTKTWKMYCVQLVAACMLAACGGGDEPVAVELRRLEGLGYQAWPTKNYVIRSDIEWQAAWDESERVDPSATRPAIDFTKDALIGVSAGWGGCDNFGIARITRYGDDLLVEWQQTSPPPDTGCGGIMSPFYDFVLVPASIRGRVDFVKVK